MPQLPLFLGWQTHSWTSVGRSLVSILADQNALVLKVVEMQLSQEQDSFRWDLHTTRVFLVHSMDSDLTDMRVCFRSKNGYGDSNYHLKSRSSSGFYARELSSQKTIWLNEMTGGHTMQFFLSAGNQPTSMFWLWVSTHSMTCCQFSIQHYTTP